MKRMRKVVGFLVVAFILASCGGSSNNDQGVVFTLFGFQKRDADGELADSTGDVIAISFSEGEDQLPINFVTAFLQLQNNLAGQLIRTETAFLEYVVAGATAQPPSTVFPLNTVLGPASGTNSSSLPPGAAALPSRSSQEIAVVTPDVLAWINLNRTSLPELPFTLNVIVRVRGVTSAGDVIETNELVYPVLVAPDNTIPPSQGSDDSSDDGSDEVSGDTDVTEDVTDDSGDFENVPDDFEAVE